MISNLLNLCVISCLVIVSIHDIRTRQILPLIYPIILILSLWDISFYSLICGAILFTLTLVLGLFGGFGGGDIKLMAVCGIYLGFPLSIPFFFITFFCYFLFFISYLGVKKLFKKPYSTSTAFAPYITIGMIVTLILERII